MIDDKYIPIIGLEIHVELKTQSKMFCGCPADYFGSKPNTHCCPVCLGLPGALPVPNKKAIDWCLMLGMALNCQIPHLSKFDRKNYFYPDLPKGYQISQYDQPLAINGYLDISPFARGPLKKRIGIRRVHLEEDTGKLLHRRINGNNVTLIDFNRSGVPLVEIVTEPDIENSFQAKVFLKKIHQIIRYLGISDADMEKGSMRLEPNVSVQEIPNPKSQIPKNKNLPKYKVEVKNINSFNFVKKAIDYEIERQIQILEDGKIPLQETRGWNEKRGITESQRSKEEAHDYRYFPEPDIPPIIWQKKFLENLRHQIPELPDSRLNKFMGDYSLSEYDATILTTSKTIADYFEKAVKLGKNKTIPKVIANFIINKKIILDKTTPAELIKIINQSKATGATDDKIIKEVINRVIANNQKAVADYKGGKAASLMFLIGQVMRQTKGKADANLVRKLLQKGLQ